jgi:hypothetical protein
VAGPEEGVQVPAHLIPQSFSSKGAGVGADGEKNYAKRYRIQFQKISRSQAQRTRQKTWSKA